MLLAQPIGIFDSGIGGLSVARAVRELMPYEDILYIADSEFMPYGHKTAIQVRERCHFIATHFQQLQAKAIVVACNTATMAAIGTLRAQFEMPIIGVEPGVKPAMTISSSGVVGVLATPATIASASFKQLCERQISGKGRVIYQPCAELASRIEALQLEDEYMLALLRSYTQPLLEQGVDTLVLGCTHYAFLLAALRAILPAHVKVVSTEQAVALQVQRRIGKPARACLSKGQLQLKTSAHTALLQEQLAVLWPEQHSAKVTQV